MCIVFESLTKTISLLSVLSVALISYFVFSCLIDIGLVFQFVLGRWIHVVLDEYKYFVDYYVVFLGDNSWLLSSVSSPWTSRYWLNWWININSNDSRGLFVVLFDRYKKFASAPYSSPKRIDLYQSFCILQWTNNAPSILPKIRRNNGPWRTRY